MAKVASVGLFFCYVIFVASASAQIKSSTITGNVTDSSGAIVVGAAITVTNTNTGVSTSMKSSKDGDFTVPYLQEGKYSVQVEASGFKTYRAEGLALGTGVTLRTNAVLQVGTVTQTTDVNASTAQLQTESASVQGSVSTEVIMNVPNITNNPLYYATLQAGVLPTPGMANGQALGVGYVDRISYSAMNINGSPAGTGDVQIDGLSVQGSAWHEATVLPNRDAVQEVRVNTNSLSADMGGGQGVVSVATKSGTNQFHGDLNYRMRNEAFNANGLSNNLQGIPRGKFRLNEGGGALGGPVILPHLFNGKDKVFFFVSFSRLSHTQPANGFATVPTAQQRTGDFGATLTRDFNGNPIPVQIYNPFLATPFNATTVVRPEYPQGNCDAAFLATYGRCGDQVSNPNPYGLKIMNAYPLPNHAPSDLYGNNNYYYSGTAPEARNNLSARMDFHFGKHSLYTSGGLDNGYDNGFNIWGKGPWYHTAPGFNALNFNDSNPFASVGDTITLNPTTLVDVRVGVTRLSALASDPVATNFTSSDYSAYGMPLAVQQYIALPGSAPVVGTPGCCFSLTFLNQNGWSLKNEHQTNYMLAGSVTKVAGKWTLRNGAEYREYLGNWADLRYSTPALAPWGSDSYNEQYANLDGTGSNLNTTSQQGGYANALYAMGTQGWVVEPGTTTKPALSTKYLAFYSQNDWKVTRKLTLNLGLRYEIQPATTERFNHMSDVDLTAPNPFASGTSANPLGGMGAIVFAGRNGYGRGLWNTQWNNISPRLGAAYQLSDSMVIRSGFGRVYTPSNTGFNANGLIYGGAPWSGGTASIPFGITHNGLPAGTFDNPAATQIIPAPGAVQAPQLYGNLNGSQAVDYFLNKNFKNGYIDQWNVAVEKRLGGWVSSVAYVGSRGADLGWRLYNINGQFDIPWATLTNWQNQWEASNGANNPGYNLAPNPFPKLIGQAYGDAGLTSLPYWETQLPYFGLLNQTVYASKGSSLFNSLQIRAQHPVAHGLTALFTYTWSRNTGVSGGYAGSTYAQSQVTAGSGNYAPPTAGNLNGVDYRNPGNNNSLLSYDTPQRFVGVLTYELPFGKGKRFDPQNGILRALVGGWEVDPVITLQSGEPWAPSCGSENGRCLPTGQRLELPHSLQHWYDGNTTVTLPDGRMVTPPPYTFLKWNPDAFSSQIVQWADGSSHNAEYWLGTTPMFMGSLRMPWYANVNLAVSKSFVFTERVKLQLLAEASNLFNRTNFLPGAVNNGYSGQFLNADPTTNSKIGQNNNPAAGTLGAALYDPRQLTLSLRLLF